VVPRAGVLGSPRGRVALGCGVIHCFTVLILVVCIAMCCYVLPAVVRDGLCCLWSCSVFFSRVSMCGGVFSSLAELWKGVTCSAFVKNTGCSH
jgi:hypothetical protein